MHIKETIELDNSNRKCVIIVEATVEGKQYGWREEFHTLSQLCGCHADTGNIYIRDREYLQHVLKAMKRDLAIHIIEDASSSRVTVRIEGYAQAVMVRATENIGSSL